MSKAVSVLFVEPPSPPTVTAYPDYRIYLADYSGYFQATRAMTDACGQIIRIRTKHRRYDGSVAYTQRRVKNAPPGPLEFRYKKASDFDQKMIDDFPKAKLAQVQIVEVEPCEEPYVDPNLPLVKEFVDCSAIKVCDSISRANDNNFYTVNQQFHACAAVGITAIQFKELMAHDVIFGTGAKSYVDLVAATMDKRLIADAINGTNGYSPAGAAMEQSRVIEDAKSKWVKFAACYIDR
jgi:hypothetical protein